MRVLPNRTKSKRPSERVRKGPHTRTLLLWQILLGSLILDPLIPLVVPPAMPIEFAVSIATVCALGTLPFLAQASMHRILSNLRHLHSRSLDVGSKTVPLSLFVGAVAVILLKVLMFAHLPRPLIIAILLFLVFGSRKFITQVRKQSDEDKALFAANPWAKVQRWEQQVLVFATLPLLLARSISVWGALAAFPPGEELTRLVFVVVSALFLGMLRPDRSFFVGMCKRCQHPVPIVFQDIGTCMNCDVNLRVAYYAWVNRLTPPPLQPETTSQEEASSATTKKN